MLQKVCGPRKCGYRGALKAALLFFFTVLWFRDNVSKIGQRGQRDSVGDGRKLLELIGPESKPEFVLSR